MALEQMTFNVGAFTDGLAGGNNYVAGQVFEVFNTNDTLANIFSDAAGTIPINQDGISNVSNSDGEVNFYILEGIYYLTVNTKRRDFNAGFAGKLINDLSQAYIATDLAEVAGITFPDGKILNIKSRNAENDWLVTSSGTADELSIISAGGGKVATIQQRGGFIDIEGCGAVAANSSFDSKPAIFSAWARHRLIKFFNSSNAAHFYVGSEVQYPNNAHELHGNQWSPISSNTKLRPMLPFPDAIIVNMNETNSGVGAEQGQFNKLVDINIDGGMVDFEDENDPMVNVISVSGINTRGEVAMDNVSFRNSGKPFSFTGYQHKHRNIYIQECFTGGDLASTHSSVIENYTILTCKKNWGELSDCMVINGIFQQANSLPILTEDVGIRCSNLVEFTGITYTEGGNMHFFLEDDAVVRITNGTLGFAQGSSGPVASSNIWMGIDSEVYVSGECIANKTSIISGDPNNARVIHMDVNELETGIRMFKFGVETCLCPTMFLRYQWGYHRKHEHHNILEYRKSTLISGQVKKLFDPNDSKLGGKAMIVGLGSNVKDVYQAFFCDNETQDPATWVINREVASPGGLLLNVTANANGILQAEAIGGGMDCHWTIEAWGDVEMKDPLTI